MTELWHATSIKQFCLYSSVVFPAILKSHHGIIYLLMYIKRVFNSKFTHVLFVLLIYLNTIPLYVIIVC